MLTVIELLVVLYKAIVAQTTVQLSYQSFKARHANDIIFYPYLLKEYRNRWFTLGMKKQGKEIVTFALDRIQGIISLPNETFRRHKQFDPQTYFSDIVGVTRNVADEPTRITFLADHYQAPYIKTKPIHPSQQIIEETKEGVTFTIDVVPNFELDRELMGFGEGLKILSPHNLVRGIKRKVRLMYEAYHTSENG